MASPGASVAVPWHPGRGRPIVDAGRLEASVRALDPGSRALLDLSLRRRVRDEAMAPHLRVDPFHVAWLRARAIERIASELGLDDPLGIGAVRAALPRVSDGAWGLPRSLGPPAEPAALELTTYASPVVARYVAPLRPPVTDKLRSAAMGARAAARAHPQTLRAAMRGALLTGAGAAIGFALSRRRTGTPRTRLI